MGDKNRIENARNLLKVSLEKSRSIASDIARTEIKLGEAKERLPSLEAEIRPVTTRQRMFSSLKEHVVNAIGPAVAVLNVYDSVLELEKALLSRSCSSDLFGYLLLIKRLEEAMKFLADNSRLAIHWLQDIVQFVRENGVANEEPVLHINKCLRILRELETTKERAHTNGGIVFVSLQKLKTEFKELVIEHSVRKSDCIGSPLEKLQAIMGAQNDNNWLKHCVSLYVEVHSTNARTSLKALDLTYIDKTITESDNVQDIETEIDQWCSHLEIAVRHIFTAEYNLCHEVFGKTRLQICAECFARIAIQSGLPKFIEFGAKVTNCKKDPVKLLKLLDIFTVLDDLRGDFNRLFGAGSCSEIQTLTRDLIKRVVTGVCEIFEELPSQVEVRRKTQPPRDATVPRLVSFITDYCTTLLSDKYRPLLRQVLYIDQTWNQEKYKKQEDQDQILRNQIYNIVRQIGLNLDTWSSSYKASSTILSYLFMMNNHYHFTKLRGTMLGDLMGEPWLKAHDQYKDYYMAIFLKESWGKFFALLNNKNDQESVKFLSSPTKWASSDSSKKRLKSFNVAFDEVYNEQLNLVVPNEELRLKMCKTIVQAIVPAYKRYLENCGGLGRLSSGNANNSPSKYVKYSAYDLEIMLRNLYQPSKIRTSASRKSTHFVDKIKNVASDNFGLTLMAM